MNIAEAAEVLKGISRPSGYEALIGIDQAILDAIPVAVYICSAEGLIVRFNKHASELWGRSPQIGVTHELFCGSFRLFHRDGRPLPHSETPMATALRTGEQQRDLEAIVERPDGSRILALVNIDPLLAPGGQIEGAINCFQDVTRRKQAEQDLKASQAALHESEARYRAVVDTLPAAIYTTDPEGRITYYNDAAAELWGQRPKLGENEWCGSWKLYWPDGRPMRHDECPMAIALKEKRAVNGMEAVAERPDGSRVSFQPYPTPLFDASGALTGAVNMLVDLSERKLAEQARRRLASIVESSDDAIVSKNLDGTIVSWNRGAETLFGYSAEEVTGKSITIIIPSDHQHEETEILARIRRGDRIDHYETIRQRKDGTFIDISLTVSPVRDADGRVVGASKIARNITERKRAEAALARRIEEQSALYRFTDRLHRAESLNDIYDAALDTIAAALRCSRASILLLDTSGVMRFVTWRGLSDSYRRAVEGHSPWNPGEKQPEPIHVDALEDSDLPESLKAVIRAERIGSAAFIPLVSNGQLIGKFMAYHETPHDFTEAELDLGLTIARQLAFSIEKVQTEAARLAAKNELRASETRLATEALALARLTEASSRLWRVRDISEGLEEILTATIELVGADMGNIRLFEDQRQILRIAAHSGFEREFIDSFREVSAGDDTISGRILRRGERVIIEDVEVDSEFAALRPIAQRAGFRAVQSTPLIGRNGTPLGMLSTHFRSSHRPSEQDLRRLDLYVRQATDFIERCRIDDALLESEARERARAAELQTIMEAVPAAIWIAHDAESRIVSGNPASYEFLGLPKGENHSLSAADGGRFAHVQFFADGRKLSPDEFPVQRAAGGEHVSNFEFETRLNGGPSRHLVGNASPLLDSEGRPRGAVAAFLDITSRKEAEAQRDLLVAELSHRVKNTLATVISIARQSFSRNPDIDEARRVFDARIRALARTHSRLAEANWSSVSLNAMVLDEFAPFSREDGANVCTSGPSVALSPKCALTLGMVVHELATNAAKYGALSARTGRVHLGWQIDGANRQLQIYWSETGGPKVAPPTRSGFGRLLIERAPSSDLGGDVKMDFAEGGLKCSMSIPLEHILGHDVPTLSSHGSN